MPKQNSALDLLEAARLRVGEERRVGLAVVVEDDARPVAERTHHREEGRGMGDDTVDVLGNRIGRGLGGIVEMSEPAAFIADALADMRAADKDLMAPSRQIFGL